jgi:hypothetical protein
MFAPWQSGGQVFRIGPDKLLFQGRAEGIMYIEDGKGALGGDIMVRTVLGEMASDLGSGETIGGATGLAIWPSLSYKIPGN